MNREARPAADPRLYPTHPLVGVGVVVRGPAGVLLVRRARPPRRGEWSIPGGLVRLGEPVEEAARREVREETGLELGPLDLVAVVDSIERDARGRVRRHYVLVDFTAEAAAGVARAGSDAAEVRWFAPAELDALPLWERTREVILRAVARGRGAG